MPRKVKGSLDGVTTAATRAQDHDGRPAPLAPLGRGHDPGDHQEHDDDRVEEHPPEHQADQHVEAHVPRRAEQRRHPVAAGADQPVEGLGPHQDGGDHAHGEQRQGRQDEGHGVSLFVLLEPGGYELPRLPEPDGRGQGQADVHGHLQAGREALGRARYDQVGGDEVLVVLVEAAVGLGHEVEHRVVEEPARDRGHDDGDGAVQDPPPQFGQVLEQRHPAAVVVRLRRARLWPLLLGGPPFPTVACAPEPLPDMPAT